MLRVLFFAAMVGLLSSASAKIRCRGGSRLYNVSFVNRLTSNRFGDKIPKSGLVFSPLAAVSHSTRQSFLTVRGFASLEVQQIAKTGNNVPFIRRAGRLRRRGEGVLQEVSADGPTMPGSFTQLRLKVDCKHPFITVLGMIAPSPDWIVQVNNVHMLMSDGKFLDRRSGNLLAYDAGVDSGREFTDPNNLSLDKPTAPRQNIAPLAEDETDRFNGVVVGKYVIERAN